MNFLLFALFSLCSAYVKLNIKTYNKNNTNQYGFEAYLGTPPQKLNLKISLESHVSFLVSKEDHSPISYNNSSTFTLSSKEIRFQILDKSFTGNPATDVLKIQDTNIEKFSFLLVKVSPDDDDWETFDGVLGVSLSFDYMLRQYSFLTSLQDNMVSNSRNLYFNFDDKNNPYYLQGEIFGNETSRLNNRFFHMHRVNKVTWGQTKFSVNIYLVYVNSRKNSIISEPYAFERTATFTIKNEYIETPSEFYYYIRDNYFREYIINETCEEVKSHNYIFIQCIHSANPVNRISLVFGGWTYHLEREELWVAHARKEEAKNFVFVLNENSDAWCIGTRFLEKYDVLFNVEFGHVGIFYNREQRGEIN